MIKYLPDEWMNELNNVNVLSLTFKLEICLRVGWGKYMKGMGTL